MSEENQERKRRSREIATEENFTVDVGLGTSAAKRSKNSFLKQFHVLASLPRGDYGHSPGPEAHHGLRALHAVRGWRPVLMGSNMGLYLRCLVQNWILVGSQ